MITSASPRVLRYAVIGSAGAVATKHLRALARLPAEIVGMCDVDEARGKPGALACGPGVAFATDALELVREVHPDVVVICTPPAAHASLARTCLLRGVHVLIEKPMAMEVAEADELVATSERAGAVLAVAFGDRFLASVEHARRVLGAGELGRLRRVLCVQAWPRDPLYYASSTWRGTWLGEGGGVLMNQAPHPLDLLCHLVGSPARVWGMTRTAQHAIECEDTAQAMLEYPGGGTGYLAFTTAQTRSERRLEIVGEAGSLAWDGDRLTVRRWPSSAAASASTPRSAISSSVTPAPREASASELVVLEVRGPDASAQEAVHRDLRRAILERTRPRCDGGDGVMSLELANAIALSSATGCPVRLPLDRQAYSVFLRQRQAG